MNRSHIAALIISALATAHGAQAALINVAAGKTYAYYGNAPGEGEYYHDDGHIVHTSGLGVFSMGELTDGILQAGSPDAQVLIPSPDVSFYGTMGRIVIDLGALYALSSVDLGTNRYQAFANFRPEAVNLLFSTDGSNFGVPVQWDVPTNASEGQMTFSFDLPSTAIARYVQFDFATPGQPTTEIHFDELRAIGEAVTTTQHVPEPSSVLLASLALAGLVCQRQMRRTSKDKCR
ncbi:MAG TPA: discoidin domain-containing protein [Rhodoferax sp.]|nr:discoidin domain-containing protein [Rhodoferax sp.]